MKSRSLLRKEYFRRYKVSFINKEMESITDPTPEQLNKLSAMRPLLMGQVAANIKDVLPAKQIVEDMTRDAIRILRENNRMIAKL